jgi:hypothetical protein
LLLPAARDHPGVVVEPLQSIEKLKVFYLRVGFI